MIQVVKISFKNPDTGEIVTSHFMGPAAFTKDEFDKIKQQRLGDVVTALVIGEPEDPMDYAESHPEMKDLMESMADLREEIGLKST